MAANLFGRYIWLIDTLRRYKRLTFQEIFSNITSNPHSISINWHLPKATKWKC